MHVPATDKSQSGATNIVKLPLAFVRSGYVDLYYGQARYVGERGYGRSGNTQSSIYGYNLNMYTTDVYPSGYSGRRDGFSLRCLYPYTL